MCYVGDKIYYFKGIDIQLEEVQDCLAAYLMWYQWHVITTSSTPITKIYELACISSSSLLLLGLKSVQIWVWESNVIMYYIIFIYVCISPF